MDSTSKKTNPTSVLRSSSQIIRGRSPSNHRSRSHSRSRSQRYINSYHNTHQNSYLNTHQNSYLNTHQNNVMEETPNEREYASAETHHIIKFRANTESPVRKGAVSKARHAIKKRINKKATNKASEDKKKFASDTSGIEASIRKSASFTNKRGLSKTRLKSGSGNSRGRSVERRNSISAVKQTFRSLSRKRSMSKGRFSSNASVGSVKSMGFVEKVKSFRRDRSIVSVRSTRSNFSTRSNKSRRGWLGFFRRKNKNENEGRERVMFVKQAYTPETVKAEPEEEPSGGLFESMLCNSFDITICSDIFSRTEDLGDDPDKLLGSDDDPRYFGDESSNDGYSNDYSAQQTAV